MELSEVTKQQRDKCFDAAKKVIETVGWCQGFQARNKNGGKTGLSANDATQFCIGGAIGLVANHENVAKVARLTLADLIERRTGSRAVSVWNDDPRRTREQVAVLLEDAKSQRMPAVETIL